MATTTIYGDPSDGGASSRDDSYPAAREGTGSVLTIGDFGTAARTVQNTLTAFDEYNCDEVFLAWDTSSISGEITAAALSLYARGGIDEADGAWTMEARELDWGSSLGEEDWVAGSGLSSHTLLASLDSGSLTSGAYNTLAESGTNLQDWVSKTGYSRLFVSHSQHRVGTVPTGANGTSISTADADGTTEDPKLVITYTVPIQPPTLSGLATLASPAVISPIAPATLPLQPTLHAPTVTVPTIGVPAAASRPQRTDSVRVELLDQHGNILGQVHPAWDRAPTVEVDVSATIPRRLTGVRLDPTEAEEIDVYSHRLRPVWTQAGVDYPMGLYVWSTADRQRDGWGVSLTSGTLHDLTMALHQPLTESFAADEGATITDRLEALVQRYGITDYAISPSDQTTSSPLSWAAGKPGSKALDALTSKLSYVWWFDRDGLLRAELEPDPDVHAPDHWYEEAHVRPGVAENQDPFMTPNVWLVTTESAESSAVVGTYRLPQTNEASSEQRGFDVVKPIRESGISSTAQADKRARQAADESQTTTQVEIVTTPNPGHDLHDIVAWRGTPYREIGWSLPLDPAGEHSHTLRRRDDAL